MIKSIKLEIKGKEVEFTLDELQALQSDIEKIFPKPQYYPAPYPVYPAPVLPSYPYYPSAPTVLYGDNTYTTSNSFSVKLIDKEDAEREAQVSDWVTAYRNSEHTRKTGFDL